MAEYRVCGFPLFNRLQRRQYGVPDGEDFGFAAARSFLPFAQAFEEDAQTGHSIVLQLFGFGRRGISLKHQVGCNQRKTLYFYFNRVFLKTASDKNKKSRLKTFSDGLPPT